ncbi:uncharacterized protein B0H18DRAFT_1115777 [Fomitopsis serialis]|uniref:uncharacterized protein n=1 Tax=Fomitopsis serialis TaxID=139415 RepID=UPI00200784F8|nr:uncharacterized protein B0H18DRAFT_1115777 [Neoantrodia serialis]KAH9932528.1 hypothetical protein B0H18DRAFT_1115777 [Neoantrodia serialis]
MSGLEVLAIRHLRPFLHHNFFLGISRLQSVKSLQLSQCTFSNISQLRRIVCALPQLLQLALSYVRLRVIRHPPGYNSIHYVGVETRLRSLSITLDGYIDESMEVVIDWIFHSGIGANLQDLSVWVGDPAPDPALRQNPNKLLAASGPSLTQYTEQYQSGPYGRKRHAGHLDFAANTTLQAFAIALDTIRLNRGQRSDWLRGWSELVDQLRGILATVRSRQVRDIKINGRIRFWSEPAGDFTAITEDLDLARLHEVMSQPSFDAVHEVEVKVEIIDTVPRTSALSTNLDCEKNRQRVEDIFRGLLNPWSGRATVRVSMRSHYPMPSDWPQMPRRLKL